MSELEWPEGSFSWADINSPDPQASAAFYGALFGWTAEDQGPDFGNYVMFSLGGEPVAGMGPQPPELAGMPAMWSSYIAVDDADATAAKVVEAGGEVHMPPMDVADHGRMAFFTDPTGAMFGVWQAGKHTGAGAHMVPGARCWTELLTRDVDRAGSFYLSVFPWEAAVRDMGSGPYTMFMMGEDSAAGMVAMGEQIPADVPPHWLSYWVVSSCDGAAAQTVELGGQVVMPGQDIPDIGRFAILTDPQGGTFAILEPPADAS